MDKNETLNEILSQIMNAEASGNYSSHSDVMAELVKNKHKLELMADLANLLPTSSFRRFFVINIPFFSQFKREEFIKLYELCRDSGVAIYNLTLVLVTVGGIRGEALQKLCGECPDVKKIEQFQSALRGDPAPADSDDLFKYEHFEKSVGVTYDEILLFRESFLKN